MVQVFRSTTMVHMIRGMNEHAATAFAPNPHVAVGLNKRAEGDPYSTFQLEHLLNMEALRFNILSNSLIFQAASDGGTHGIA
jgi:hypothetical protein